MGIYLGPLRLSRRGVRVRIGPGFSTGAGTFTWYRPLRRRRHRLR